MDLGLHHLSTTPILQHISKLELVRYWQQLTPRLILCLVQLCNMELRTVEYKSFTEDWMTVKHILNHSSLPFNCQAMGIVSPAHMSCLLLCLCSRNKVLTHTSTDPHQVTCITPFPFLCDGLRQPFHSSFPLQQRQADAYADKGSKGARQELDLLSALLTVKQAPTNFKLNLFGDEFELGGGSSSGPSSTATGSQVQKLSFGTEGKNEAYRTGSGLADVMKGLNVGGKEEEEEEDLLALMDAT